MTVENVTAVSAPLLCASVEEESTQGRVIAVACQVQRCSHGIWGEGAICCHLAQAVGPQSTSLSSALAGGAGSVPAGMLPLARDGSGRDVVVKGQMCLCLACHRGASAGGEGWGVGAPRASSILPWKDWLQQQQSVGSARGSQTMVG